MSMSRGPATLQAWPSLTLPAALQVDILLSSAAEDKPEAQERGSEPPPLSISGWEGSVRPRAWSLYQGALINISFSTSCSRLHGHGGAGV